MGRVKNSVSFIILISILSLFTGCAGSIGERSLNKAPQWSQSSQVSPLVKDNGDYLCPQEPNVVPDYDWAEFEGAGNFEVCAHKNTSEKILVRGSTHYSTRVCVFPAFYNESTGELFALPDLLSDCKEMNPEESEHTFPQPTTFNAVFIVEEPFKEQMENCLQNLDYYQCPNRPGYFSYGQFR